MSFYSHFDLSAYFKQNTLKKCKENASLGKRSREKLPFPESYLTSEASLKNIPSPWESRLKCKKLRKYHPRLEKDAQTWKFFFPCSFRSVSSGGLYYPWVGLYYLLASYYKLLTIQFSTLKERKGFFLLRFVGYHCKMSGGRFLLTKFVKSERLRPKSLKAIAQQENSL